MLAGDAVDVQWQNPIDRFDVNNDSQLTPSDAHIIANAMLANGRRRLILPETGFPTGAYPDVKLDALVSRADFDMVVWEMDRRARESEAGGGMGMASGDNYPPSATHGIADFLRWGESDEIDTVFGYELFDDPDHEDTELTFAAFVSGDINIIDDIIFNPSTGEYDIYYVLGEWGTATITLRATDPEAAYAEVWFDVTSVLVLDYDLQWKDQGTWVGIPSDQGILTNDELRGRMIHTPIPPEFVVSMAFKHKEWFDAEDDVDANDAVSGLWQYPLITDAYPDGAGGVWLEFQVVPSADLGFTPEIDFGQFRYAAQLLPAKQENVYTIQDPVWEGIELADGETHFEEAGNPEEFGGGDRFFAERNVPSGRAESVLHDSVNLVVSLDRHVREGREVTVAVKLFDPDHYAANPFDTNDFGGATAPSDNIMPGGQTTYGAGSGTEGTGANLAESVVVDENTISVKTPLQVIARQPTNNFRAATFNPRIPRADIQMNSDGKSIFRFDKPTDTVPQSPLLTIWRHLYIEQDSMDGPMWEQGPGASRILSGDVLNVSADRKTLTLDTDLDEGAENQFQGGYIFLLDANNQSLGDYRIASNDTEADSTVTLVEPLPASVAASVDKFGPLEDDDIEHDVTIEKMEPDLELFASRFRPACVEFDPAKNDLRSTNADPVNDLGQVTFDQNTTDAEFEGLQDTWRRSATEKDFWSAYLVGAFQPHVDEDHDNDGGEFTAGTTSTEFKISLIFRETVTDVATELPEYYQQLGETDHWRVVGLHEVGHQFALGHLLTEDGSIMHYDSIETMPVDQLVFSAKGLQKITARDFPREATFFPDP